MVANNTCVVCPKCKTVNSYDIVTTKLYDNDLHIAYQCDACKSEFTNVYTLVYMGGSCGAMRYDRDNISL